MIPVAVLAVAAAFLVTPALAVADADVGQRGNSYGDVVAPTAEKPQNKLWFHDGSWWASMLNTATMRYEIHRLDDGHWGTTGVTLDTRRTSKGDVLADGDRLYVASAGPHQTNDNHSPRVWRYSYDRSARTYRLDQGFPVNVAVGGTRTVVIDRDSTGKLWLTYTRDNTVFVAHSTSSDTQWTEPYPLPVAGATGLLGEDIASVVAYDGHVGVMWSNQVDETMYFAYHRDGDGDQVWTSTIAARDPRIADDHINLTALRGDPAGKVFAATKTERKGGADPLILLLVLGEDGQWTRHTVATVADDHTRPIVLIDGEGRRVYVLMSAPCCSGGTIYYKESDLDRIEFEPGLGTPFIRLASDPNMNNPSSTKQTLDASTGLVAIAGDDRTRFYGWNRLELTGGGDGGGGDGGGDDGGDDGGGDDGGGDDGGGDDGGGGDTDPPGPVALFGDGFESGDFSRWDTVAVGGGGSAAVQSDRTSAGSYAARFRAPAASGAHAYARTTLSEPLGEHVLSGMFFVEDQGDRRHNVPLFRLYGTSGSNALVSIERENKPPNRILVSHGTGLKASNARLTLGSWGRLEVAVVSGTLTVGLDGSQIYSASAPQASDARTIQIGSDMRGEAFQLVVDEVEVAGR